MYLILDQGGSSSRALVLAPDGTVAARAQVPVGTRRAAGGLVEQDPDELVASLERCIADVARSVPPAEWLAAGLACQRSSVVAWNRDTGAPLSAVLSWQDTRAAARFDDVAIDRGRLRAITGLPPSAHYGATKIAWLLDGLPRTRATAVGPLASFLLHRLLDGRPCRASHTLAQRTLLYDVGARDWSDELLHAFGIPRDVLPEAVDDCGAHGTLRGVPFQVCAGDQNVVPFASGGRDSDTAYLNLGTGAFLLRPVARAADVPDGLLLAPLDGPPDRRSLAAEGTVNGAGSAIAWYERESGAVFPWSSLATVDRAGAPLFVNAVGGIGAPFWRADLEPRFEPDAGDALQRAYAVVESIAFLVRANLERLPPVTHLLATGGLARRACVIRSLADATGVPVAAGAQEATAHGAFALLVSAALRVAAARGADPDAHRRVLLDARYARWCELPGLRAG